MKMKGLLIALLLLPLAAIAQEREGAVVDGANGKPIAGAVVTAGNHTMTTEAQGQFRAPDGTAPVQVRAVGYGRQSLAADASDCRPKPMART